MKSKIRSMLALLALLFATSALAGQATIVGPIVGPMSEATLMGIVNNAFQAIQSCNSGTTAPANGPGAVPMAYQCWADTSTTPTAVKQYDGTTWVVRGWIDVATHTFAPAQKIPVTLTGASGSVGLTDYSVIINATTTFTLTLPSAAAFPGRLLNLKTIGTTTVVTSASSNVVPLNSTTAGTAIMPTTAPKIVLLQSDGTNWITMDANF